MTWHWASSPWFKGIPASMGDFGKGPDFLKCFHQVARSRFELAVSEGTWMATGPGFAAAECAVLAMSVFGLPDARYSGYQGSADM